MSARKVSKPLMLGIFLFPFIFSFLTLRKGYSKKVRIIAFLWLLFLLAVGFSDLSKQPQQAPPVKPAAQVEKAEQIDPTALARIHSTDVLLALQTANINTRPPIYNGEYCRDNKFCEIYTDEFQLQFTHGIITLYPNSQADQEQYLTIASLALGALTGAGEQTSRAALLNITKNGLGKYNWQGVEISTSEKYGMLQFRFYKK